MKQVTPFAIFLLMTAVSLGQPTASTGSSPSQHYLQKSKHQKKTGTILVLGGLGLEVAGAIAYKSGNAGIILPAVGILAQITSIPFFVSSSINKKKSKRASPSL